MKLNCTCTFVYKKSVCYDIRVYGTLQSKDSVPPFSLYIMSKNVL